MPEDLARTLLRVADRGQPRGAAAVLGEARRQIATPAPQRPERRAPHPAFAVAAIVLVTVGGLVALRLIRSDSTPTDVPAPTTTSPPTATELFLSGMLTEEVEPGVVRVVNDGHRDVTHRSDGYPWDCERIIVGRSDQVWRASGCWQLVRLGQPGEWDYDPEWVDLGWGRSFASLDGRLWAIESGGPSSTAPHHVRLFDDGEWVPDPRLDVPSESGSIHVGDDGTVWLLAADAIHWAADTSVEGEPSRGSSSWSEVWVGDGDRDAVSLVSVSDHGVVWLMTEPAADGSVSFLRFDGSGWEVVAVPDGFDGGEVGVLAMFGADVSANGVVWSAGDSLAPHLSLARLDADGWTTFSGADGVRPWGGQRYVWNTKMDTLWAAPDGSAWVNASVADIRADGSLGCDGLARFDGRIWQPFLAGHCISDLDFTPDGAAWVVARDPQGDRVDTYVITPGGADTPATAAPASS